MQSAKPHDSRGYLAMTEDEARGWLTDELGVSGESLDKLDAFRMAVIEESARQNLISAATIEHFWARHIVDSAQLLPHTIASGTWLDLGTGAGFPGVVVALLRDAPMIFVESRRKRIDFLSESVEMLGLTNVRIHGGRLETMPATTTSVISARAFAPLPKLLDLAHRFSNNETIWALPKGRTAHEELETVKGSWQGTFHVKQSVTDPEASIIVANGVRRMKRAGK
jgi:16S rRNA (guanine527-N7)-methyltransferase